MATCLKSYLRKLFNVVLYCGGGGLPKSSSQAPTPPYAFPDATSRPCTHPPSLSTGAMYPAEACRRRVNDEIMWSPENIAVPKH